MTDEEWNEVYGSRITPTTKLEESRVLLEYDQSEIWAEEFQSDSIVSLKGTILSRRV